MLLIHPPVAKSCEPPAGIACLAGAVRAHGVSCTLVDANLEGQLFLLHASYAPKDNWGRRACRDVGKNLDLLRSKAIYSAPDRYRRAVFDLNRVLELAGSACNVSLSLANYQDPNLSPLRSIDLLRATERPEENVFYPYFSSRLPQLVDEKQPSLVGFSLNYLSQATCTFAMIGFLRSRYPDLTVVLGGGLVTSWLRNPAWQNPFSDLVDHLIAGPGEDALLSLIGCKSNNFHHTPDYTDLDLSDYLSPGGILPYAASSGCYWNRCSFCPEKAEENPYVPLTEKVVLDDVSKLIAQSNPVMLHFLDNAINPKLMRALVDSPPGLPWYGFARVSPQLVDEDFCKALRQSGCVMLKLGLESGDQGVLDAMDKGIELGMVSAALAALKKAGIATYVYLLFGTPTETLQEARRTLDFVVEQNEAITFLNLAVFNMPLCAPEVEHLAVQDFYKADLSLYTDFVHPLGWHRKDIRQFLDQEFKRHPAIAAILRRDPPLFTSNHAAFFC